MDKEKFPNRIRELRLALGMTQETLAGLTELSEGYLSKLESGKRNLSLKIMPRIAQALGVKPSELIDVSRAWLEIDIAGIVSEDQQIIHVLQGDAARHKLTANVPAALGEVEAVLVTGNALYPRYSDGDVITFMWRGEDVNSLAGKECVVLLKNGKRFIKTITPGTSPGKYHLTSFSTPPVLDAEVEKAARIGIVLRA